MSNEGPDLNQENPSQTPSPSAEIPKASVPESIPASYERQPLGTAAISVILPIFNDGTNLKKSLAAWTQNLEELNRDYEILVVDDASTDETASLADELTRERIHSFHHEKRRGLGAALRTGLEAARFPLILISTCDDRYQPADLQRFLKWIDKVDMVCGVRTRQTGGYNPTWADRVYRWIVRLVFGLRLRDPQCLFLLARRSIFARIPVQTDGSLGFTEILAKANFLGCLMHETSVSFQANSEAETKWSSVSLRDKLAGFRRLFSKPDFGPPTLPQDQAPSH